ncbi:hypothetical protein Turpa_1592 [Turneriella parva DSM 21527]|uniref:DUF4139 domain-containing protein n=1 Tax=Turneriella parva (strain ATCC BAA-1111 / DSM 21527 / NCTC 11395 / H) TaxID=869212 RepID=I4B4N3_TURPD|nr:hypothetical protein Turpa_1592 [Turneriella parva DSM 21527]
MPAAASKSYMSNRVKSVFLLLFIGVALNLPVRDLGATIELVTVPKSQAVQLTIYNSADITMVKESRELTFKPGLNTIQFSWAGTLIDPTSLRLTFLDNKGKLTLRDTSFPPGRNDALQWNIDSELSGSARVEINYFTSGITWNADYTAITNAKENAMNIDGFIRVINNSGEDYPNAEVRLVVGTVNLVEDIAGLAQGKWRYADLDEDKRDRVRNGFKRKMKKAEAAKAMMEAEDIMPSPAAPASGYSQPKEIVKEGLSEYFLFTVEGKEKIPNGWQKRLKAFSAKDVDVKVIYRASDRLTGGSVHKFYEFRNTKEKGADPKISLGVSPLPDGTVHIFSEDAKNNLSYQGGIYMKYAATGDKVKLDAGQTREVVLRTFTRDFKRGSFVTETRYDKSHYVKEWVDEYFYEHELENTLGRAVSVEIERTFPGNFEPGKISFKYEKVDSATIKFFPEVDGREKKKIAYSIRIEHKE